MSTQAECGKNLLNGKNHLNNKLNEQQYQQELRKIRRFLYALSAVVTVGILILIVVFAVLFAKLSERVENHTHKPKVGAQIDRILQREELCIPCDEVRLGPSPQEDRMLDYFVRKHEPEGEQCCVETPNQLLKMLQLFVERKYRQEMAYGNIKINKNTDTEPGETRPAAHLMGSVTRLKQPVVPGRHFSISHWINDTDLAFINKVEYRHGRIVILQSGFYYVYSQVAFLEVYDTGSNVQETGSPSLSHYLYRYNIVYPHGGEESLIQNSITKCWGKNQSFGEYSSYLGAVFHLRQGDELFVKVSNLSLIVREPKLNYFGLYKIN